MGKILIFYCSFLGLTDVYNNGKTVSGEKLFASYELVFELTKGLCDCQNNYIRTNKVGVLVKNETNKVYDREVYFQLHNQ